MAKPDLQTIYMNPVTGLFYRLKGKLGLAPLALDELPDAANDAAAALAGVEVGGVYRNGSILQVRVV